MANPNRARASSHSVAGEFDRVLVGYRQWEESDSSGENPLTSPRLGRRASIYPSTPGDAYLIRRGQADVTRQGPDTP